VTLSHAGALEKVRSILTLGEKEVVLATRDRDPKDGELGVKKLGEATKKLGRRGCQDDVVDVE
jgi:hypothetical protein